MSVLLLEWTPLTWPHPGSTPGRVSSRQGPWEGHRRVVPAGRTGPPGKGQCLLLLTAAPWPHVGLALTGTLVKFSRMDIAENKVQKTRARGCPETKVPPVLCLPFQKTPFKSPCPIGRPQTLAWDTGTHRTGSADHGWDAPQHSPPTHLTGLSIGLSGRRSSALTWYVSLGLAEPQFPLPCTE